MEDNRTQDVEVVHGDKSVGPCVCSADGNHGHSRTENPDHCEADGNNTLLDQTDEMHPRRPMCPTWSDAKIKMD